MGQLTPANKPSDRSTLGESPIAIRALEAGYHKFSAGYNQLR
jgi:hypothetical protein